MKKNRLLVLSLMAVLITCGCEDVNNTSNSAPKESTPIVENSSTQQSSNVEQSSMQQSSNVEQSSTQQSSNIEQSSTPSSSNIEETSTEILYDDKVLYVSADANDFDAKGTIDDPMLIQWAVRYSKPGSTIYLLDGEYKWGSTIMLDENTEYYPATNESERKYLKPLNKGKVKINFSQMAWNSSNRGIQINNNYWTVSDLEVFGSGDNGIYIGGSYNVVENCVTHDCGDSGIQLGRANSTLETIDRWPSYNLIKNCTSYDNHDPLGEDSDGFACKLTTGVGNAFEGCIAYNNVDDGWDLYTKGDSGSIGPVTLRNCIAFNNGVTSGRHTNGKPYGTPNSDGNGFKLGGETISVPHQVYNCIAFNNLASGFTDNSNPGPLYLENCTAYNNGLRDADSNNYDMCRDENTSVNYIKNCLSYCDANIKFTDGQIKHFNSKDQYKGTAVDSIFYYGRTMLQFKGIKACDYTLSSMLGEIIKTETTPFIDTTILDETTDFHSVWRDENGDIKLNDFLKINEEFVKEAFGTESTINLGADLS